MESPKDSAVRSLYRYRFGTVDFDEARFELRVSGLVVDVQRKPLEMLAYILRRAGEIVTKEEFLDVVWESRPTVENVVANALAKLRAALGEENGARILTLPRVGYRMTGSVERVAVGRQFSRPLLLEPGESVPQRDNFHLEAAIARSRTSEVWLARHTKTGETRVYKFSGDGEQLAALKREAMLFRVLIESLGSVDAFVKVIDWNFDSPPFFLECEYGGEDLLRWADRIDLQAVPLAIRLNIFQQLVDTVAAAHSVGVLHKDLKPSNVLIAARADAWHVRLTDFGSGRLLDPNRLSELGITELGLAMTQGVRGDSLSGTPLYIAPETLKGQSPTVQSDVYALGLILYQLLAGDLRKQLVSGWERDIPDELLREDVAAATDGDPARRLPSAAMLAERVRQLEARRGTRTAASQARHQAQLDHELLRRARARRPWIIATIGTLCVGLAVTVVLYRRVHTAQQALSGQYVVANTLIDFLTADFISRANPLVTGRKDVPVIEAAHAAAADIDVLFRHSEPQVRGALHAAMQSAFAGLNEYSLAISEGHKALQALGEASPSDTTRIAEAHIELASDLADLSRFPEAAVDLEAAAALLRDPQVRDPSLRAKFLWIRAKVDSERLSVQAAVSDYSQAMDLIRRNPEVNADLRDQIQFSYANALMSANRLTEAQGQTVELLARQAVRLGVTNARTCYTSVLLASIKGYRGDPTDADLALGERAATCLMDKLGPTSLRTASAYQVLANLQFQSGRYGAAAEAYGRLVPIFSRMLGASATRTLVAQMNVGVSRHYSGELKSAEGDLTGALNTAVSALGWSAPLTEDLRYQLADCQLDLHETSGIGHLLDGLSASLLNDAQITPDWEGRLAYDGGRLALYGGENAKAIQMLEQAAAIIAAKDPDGRISAADIERLIRDARSRVSPAGHAQPAPMAGARKATAT